MSNSKNYNSIFFLTTLSVYLGLVLVGATPSVLAQQAALTQKFEIKNEIEIEDDLDKNPDDDDFPALFIELLNEIKQSAADGKLSLPLPNDFRVIETNRIAASGIGSVGASAGEISDARLAQVVYDAIEKKFAPSASRTADFYEKYKSVEIDLSADKAEWAFSISFTKDNAAQYADFLNRKYSSIKIQPKNLLAEQVYKNTTADGVSKSLINKKVFISIRLPRSSIDNFLADKKDAQ